MAQPRFHGMAPFLQMASYMVMMEKKMETTMVYWVTHIGTMETKMETTI